MPGDIWELDINGDYQLVNIVGDEVAVNWELDVNDDVMPRVVPLDAPTAPTLALTAVGDGELTCTVGAGSATDEIYGLYKVFSSPAWIAAGLMRTGSGAVTFTGLTNGLPYELVVYAQQGTLNSVVSNTVVSIPSSGLVPTDPLIKLCDNVVTFLNSQVWSQPFVARRLLRVREDLSDLQVLTVFVVPSATESIVLTRQNEIVSYSVDIAVIRPSVGEDDLTNMMDLVHELRTHISMKVLGDFKYFAQDNTPVFSPDRLESHGMFLSIVRASYKNLRSNI